MLMKLRTIIAIIFTLVFCSCGKTNEIFGEITEEDKPYTDLQYLSIPKEALNDWDSGSVVYNAQIPEKSIFVVQKEEETESIIYVGTWDEETTDNGLILKFSSEGKFKLMVYRNTLYSVEYRDGKAYLVGYSSNLSVVEEAEIPESLANTCYKPELSETKGGVKLSDAFSLFKYGREVFNWENNSDKINTAIEIIKDNAIAIAVARLAGTKVFVASWLANKAIDTIFDGAKAELYSFCKPNITNLDIRNHTVTVEIIGVNGSALREGHTYTVAVAGRQKRMMSGNKVDYTHAEYRTQSVTVSGGTTSVTLTLNKDLEEVGDYVFVPYILIDTYNSIRYITLKEYFVQYGPAYNYSYPNAVLDHYMQNKCTVKSNNDKYVDFNVDFNVDLDSYKNVYQCRILLEIDGHTVGYGYGDVNDYIVKVNIEDAIEKKYFDKNGTAKLKYSIDALGKYPLLECSEGEKGEIELYLEEGCPDDNHVHAIDLGLSVKWACCNVGATKPEEYGNYYAWGETEWKSVYDEVTYKYSHRVDNGYHGDDWSYDNIGSNISGTQYDVAHVKWGGKWRMPTISEWTELLYNCTSEWTILNGVYGRKFTSRKNGNSIFLPAAGYRNNGYLLSVGSYGFYWSSSLYPDYPLSAYGLYFYSDGMGTYYDRRLLGLSVRPVSE